MEEDKQRKIFGPFKMINSQNWSTKKQYTIFRMKEGCKDRYSRDLKL